MQNERLISDKKNPNDVLLLLCNLPSFVYMERIKKKLIENEIKSIILKSMMPVLFRCDYKKIHGRNQKTKQNIKNL